MTTTNQQDALQLAAEVYGSLSGTARSDGTEDAGHAGLTTTIALYVWHAVMAMVEAHGSTAAFYDAVAESPRGGVPVYEVADVIAAAMDAGTTPERTAKAVLALLA